MDKIFYVRVERIQKTDDDHPVFSFYNVKADDKDDAGRKARRQFAIDFGTDFKQCEVGYIWDEPHNIDRIPAI